MSKSGNKIKRLIRAHVRYVDSFKFRHCAFSTEYTKNGKTYTCSAMSAMVEADLDKKVKEIQHTINKE